jgi:molybdate transport system ATP-binding protein
MLDVRVQRRLPDFQLDVGFRAAEEMTVLFGPSGSGKSLTLQCIAGIVRPDAGRIVADGRTLFDSDAGVNLPPQERRVGYVPQSYALFPHLTVEENIAYGLRRFTRTERAARVREMVALMALDGLEGRRPRELSGGQQQRVALARALAFRPDTLLLDEPFSSLDSGIRAELRDELLALQRRAGVTTVVVTHDLEDAFLLGQRMAVIDNGRVLQEGPREEVFYRPKSRRVAEFVRTRNVLRGTVISADEEALRIDWRGRVLEAPPRPLAPGTPVDVCIRPTQIMIVRPDRPPTEPRQNTLHGCIVEERIQAETYRLFLRLRGTEFGPAVSASAPTDCSPSAEGEPANYDVEIELPGYVYFRLGLDQRKDVTVSIRRDVVHVIAGEAT